MALLADKRVLVTGVLTPQSIAFAVAEKALAEGASVALTSFGRAMSLTARSAKRLSTEVEVIELDVNEDAHLAALPAEVERALGGCDGVLHAIAFAPQDALGGNFMTAPYESVEIAFRTSAYSYKSVAAALAPLLERPRGGEDGASGPTAAVVGLDFDATVAWPLYDWMGVAKASLESVNRYLARDLGPRGVRVNLVSAGPLRTLAAKSIPGFKQLASHWQTQAPLGWSLDDPEPVAGAVCFLLSDLAAGVTGEIVHVDGGFHAVGAPTLPDGD